MAKESGLGDNFLAGGYDLSGNVSAVGTVRTANDVADVTDITQSGHSRIPGLRDGALAWTVWFDDATGMEHDALKVLQEDSVFMYLRGTELADEAACLVGEQMNYDPTRNEDGSISIAITAEADSSGLEWCQQLTAGLRTDTSLR